MVETKIAEKDPSIFRSRQTNVKRADKIILTDLKETMNFAEMTALRKNIIPADALWSKLNSPDGHTFANIGASIALNVAYDGKTYTAVVFQKRKDYGDAVLKLISGYRDASVSFLDAIAEEVSQEFLPVDVNERIIDLIFHPELEQGIKQIPWKQFETLMQYSKEDELLIAPAENPHTYLKSIDYQKTIQGYEDLPVRLMYFSPLNTAQLILSANTSMPKGNVTLLHTEDRFNPATQKLDVILDGDGIVLLGLNNNGNLTGSTYRLVKGEIVKGPNPDKIQLSEAFVNPSQDLIVTKNNIKLGEYLNSQKEAQV